MKKYGVITKSTIHHEGDERSRTSPGHGYPAYTETIQSFQHFKDYEDMFRYYERWKKSDDVFIEYEELSFKVSVEIQK